MTDADYFSSKFYGYDVRILPEPEYRRDTKNRHRERHVMKAKQLDVLAHIINLNIMFQAPGGNTWTCLQRNCSET